MKNFVILFMLFTIGCVSKSPDIMPLQVGNKWQYFHWYDFPNSPNIEEYINVAIVDTTNAVWYVNDSAYIRLHTYIARQEQYHDDISASMNLYYAKDNEYLYQGYIINEGTKPDTIYANKIWPRYPKIGSFHEYFVNIYEDRKVYLLSTKVVDIEDMIIGNNIFYDCWKIELISPFTRDGSLSYHYFCPACGPVKSQHQYGEQSIIDYKTK